MTLALGIGPLVLVAGVMAVIPCCGRFHEGCISPDIVIYLSCILDEFVGHVVYVSSLGAGRISLEEVYVFVRTAEAVTMQAMSIFTTFAWEDFFSA